MKKTTALGDEEVTETDAQATPTEEQDDVAATEDAS